MLPVGLNDAPRQSPVKIFCPKCLDVYFPRSHRQGSLDGAFFGTTFPHLLCMVYPEVVPPKVVEEYVPRVFGYKLHSSVYDRSGGATQAGLRTAPAAAAAAGSAAQQQQQQQQKL